MTQLVVLLLLLPLLCSRISFLGLSLTCSFNLFTVRAIFQRKTNDFRSTNATAVAATAAAHMERGLLAEYERNLNVINVSAFFVQNSFIRKNNYNGFSNTPFISFKLIRMCDRQRTECATAGHIKLMYHIANIRFKITFPSYFWMAARFVIIIPPIKLSLNYIDLVCLNDAKIRK